MIEINLIPQDLKKTKDKKFNLKSLPPQYLLYLILLIFGILICLHIYLIAITTLKNVQLRLLANKWDNLGPQRKILDDYKKEHEIFSADAKVIQQLSSQRINWSKKLNKLSLNLPAGIWLNELSLNQKNFSLKGSALSLQKEELTLINKFMDNLKNDAGFFKDFTSIELSSVQRRVIAGYDVVDFILAGKLK